MTIATSAPLTSQGDLFPHTMFVMDCQLKESEATDVAKSVCNSGILGCSSGLKIAGPRRQGMRETHSILEQERTGTLVPALLGNDGLASVSKSRVVLRRLKLA